MTKDKLIAARPPPVEGEAKSAAKNKIIIVCKLYKPLQNNQLGLLFTSCH